MTEFNVSSIGDLFKGISSDQEKVAEVTSVDEVETSEDQTDDLHEKIAEDLYFGGALLAEGFIDRAFEKLAMSIPAAGGGIAPRSKWHTIVEQIAARRGKSMKPGYDMVDADDKGYPGHGSQSGRSLKDGKNPAKPLK